MKRSASSLEHTQKCYQRYLEPPTLRRGATYEKFTSDLHRKFQRTNWPATSWLRRPFSSECEFFSFVPYYLALLWRCFCMIWEFFNFGDSRLALLGSSSREGLYLGCMIGDGRISGHGACGLGSISGELVIMGSTGISFSCVAAGFVMRSAAGRWESWTWDGGFVRVDGGHVWFRFKKKYE